MRGLINQLLVCAACFQAAQKSSRISGFSFLGIIIVTLLVLVVSSPRARSEERALEAAPPAAPDLLDFKEETGQATSRPPFATIDVPTLEVDRPEGLSDIPLDLVGTFKTLDKVTARTGIIRLPVNKPINLGRLTLTMRSCRTAPPEDPPETSAFLEVDETRDGVSRRLFTGWMFASSPAMHALEHPIHDVWPMICRTSSGDIYSGSE